MAGKSKLKVFWRLPSKDEVPSGGTLFLHEQDGKWQVRHGPELENLHVVLGCGFDARLRRAIAHASQPWLSVSFGEPHDRTVSCYCKIADLQEVLNRMEEKIRETRVKDRMTVIDLEAV
jgi:hypothetical protein